MYQHRYQHIKSLILGLESGQALPKKILTIEHVSVAIHQPHPIPFCENRYRPLPIKRGFHRIPLV